MPPIYEFQLAYAFKSANVIIRNHGLANNQYLKALREFVKLSLLQQLWKGRLRVPSVVPYPLALHFCWLRAERLRMDLDNLDFNRKAIIDGMIDAGLLRNDGPCCIAQFASEFKEWMPQDGVAVAAYSLREHRSGSWYRHLP